MKTILHVIDTTGPGGAETIFIQLAKKMADNGHHSLALIRGNGWVQSQLEKYNIPFIVLDCKGSFNFKYLLEIAKIVKSKNISIIQSHLLGSNVYCSIVGLLTGTRVISTFHGEVDISPTENFRLIKLLAIQLGSSKVITVTDRLTKMVKSLPLISASKVLTIYNGIELEQYGKINTSSFRDTLNIHPNEILIGSLGNIRSPKNYPLAIRTIKSIHEKGQKVHYVVAGEGNEKQMQPLLDLTNELKLKKYIHFLGFTKKTQEFLSSLDIFLMSSSSEGHPLALTQAMVNGLAIASTKSGVELIVSNNEEAILSTEMTPESLSQAIQTLIETPELAKKISANAKLKALKHFNLDTMFQNYLKIYNI